MIVVFPDPKAAQQYCDERSKERGCPVYGEHPRTGAKVLLTSTWCVPTKHPTADRWRVTYDETGPIPDGCELVKEPGPDWDRCSPFIGAVRATPEEAAKLACIETDPVAMMVLLEKITPEQAAVAAKEHPDTMMQVALIQKENEVLIWLKNRK